MNFGEALEAMKAGKSVTRSGWNNSSISARIQFPDENSKMTKPYIYMIKGEDNFPLDMSCESILADDWAIVE